MTAEVVIDASERKIPLCTDTYAISTVYNYDVKVIEDPGKHTIVFNFKSQDEIDFINKWGLKVLRLCDKHINLTPDFFYTVLLFIADPLLDGQIGEKVPQALRDLAEEYHYTWLKKWQGAELKKRNPKVQITPKFLEQHAKSGDVLCRFAGTGISSLVMWGTGATCSNIAMFMWGRGDQKDRLFVVQSNSKGIWKQPVDDYWSENDGAGLVMLPLDPKVREKFDTEKAWDWFETVRLINCFEFCFNYSRLMVNHTDLLTSFSDSWTPLKTTGLKLSVLTPGPPSSPCLMNCHMLARRTSTSYGTEV